MYIKSVIVDGFKSYGRRTEIHGFDPEFTAITGLNGTGKSNILDSICFVLGIMNLTHVRASSLQDLVYKNGQAGITKATVTIIFDNTVESQCPIGYEKCREISVTRQIVVGGKNKYFINGKIVQNKKVADLFCSVQLNVNNPNFLIMQGRITKVLNMKPQEILSMIEEAAGTSMYESKREATAKFIEKKDAKVRETNSLLQEEVEPKLEKLRQEHSAYVELTRINREIETTNYVYISYRYLQQQKNLANIEENAASIQELIEKCRSNIVENDTECERMDEAIKEKQQRIDENSGGILKEYEADLAKELTTEAKANGNLRAAQGHIEQEEKKLKTLVNSITEDKKALQSKEQQMANMKNMFDALKQADTDDTKAYEDAQRKFEAVSKGLSIDEDGQSTSLQDQLITAKRQISEAQTTIKKNEMELRHERGQLQKKQNTSQKEDSAYLEDKRNLEKLNEELKQFEQRLNSLDYEEGTLEGLMQRRMALTSELRKLKQEHDSMDGYRYQLEYVNPGGAFDASKVHGMVGKLFSVLDEKYYLALSVAAGGSLYNIITADEVTAKMILDKGQLKSRKTFMPITKVVPTKKRAGVEQLTKKMFPSKNDCADAMELIEYETYFDPVMRNIFGGYFICREMNIAKQVTYNPQIRTRTLTLDGDQLDPEGTLSGGSKPKGCDILRQLAKLVECEKNLKAHTVELKKVEQQIPSIQNAADKYNNMKKALDMRKLELENVKSRLTQTAFQQYQTDIENHKTCIENLEKELLEARELLKKSQEKAAEVQSKLSDAKGYQDREMKAVTDAMKAAKQKSEQSKAKWKKHEQQYETLQLEIDELIKTIENAENQRQKRQANLEQIQKDLKIERQSSKSLSEIVANLKKLIKEQKEKINSENKELKQLQQKCEKLQKHNQELTLEIKKKENEATKTESNAQESKRKMDEMKEQYTWIKDEVAYFGVKNTRYDYHAVDPVKAGQKLQELRAKKDKMERTVNESAMQLLEREEEQYKETMRRKQIVETDKAKIQNIICRMDEKKRERVEEAWEVVNKNFSSIFSTLLQGADAKLTPVKQANQLIGLEIRVGFNGQWKDTLGELSGGQRSLVALSLVLAMLKFSPAPLYILDEVDAALDMSHTQNIGSMLKKHFKSSQFIIVSLKDGMFNNANVLFRTKFEEGVSCVTRTVNPKLLQRGGR